MKENVGSIDICFIKWPDQHLDTSRIDISELSKLVQTFLIIWDADKIENLADFFKFAANAMIVLVTKTELKPIVRSRIDHSLGTMRVEEVNIKEIDERTIGPLEKKEHDEKIEVIAKDVIEIILKLEALLYFFSPFDLNDGKKWNKVMKVLRMNESALSQLKELLVKNDLAAVTGHIIWLKQPLIAKAVLNDFIDNGTILIDDLMAE